MLKLTQTLFSKINRPIKMAFLVRSDLKMTTGKVAAQVAHASILCYEKSLKENPQILQHWSLFGQPKIILKVQNLEELESIYKNANNLNIVAKIVRDAGRTQVPSGTVTVLGLGPDYIENIDKLVNHLKLL